ncbi:MAG TPA: serpin family protein [Trebonia sp.]|jgi:serpin B|nr:serpin family protein [Trebonia sp.]
MRRVVLAAALVAAGSLLAACTGGPATTGAPPAPGPTVAHGVSYVEPAADPAPYGAADTAFGLDVLRAWCQTDPDANLVFSPAVLASALGMAYLGSKGPTATAMAGVLHLPAQSRDALLAGLAARLAALRAVNGRGVTLAASDFVWADPTLPPLKSYLNDVATGYDAGVGEAPFQTDPQRAAAAVNQAISRDTRGQIPKLVTPKLVAGMGWVLTSALYMDARWGIPFNPAQTAGGTFTTQAGTPVTVQYMHSPQDVQSDAVDGWTGAWLSYQGAKLGMLAILPPAGAGGCAVPSASGLAALTRAVLINQGLGARVGLPKLDISSNARMDDELKSLGMAQAFGPSADFTALSPQAASIAFVQQAATLKVDEKGTVGAAAAAVGAVPASAFAGRELDFNRPYLLLVTDMQTGEPVFLAKVANPAES